MSLLTELSLFRDNFYKHGAPMALPLNWLATLSWLIIHYNLACYECQVGDLKTAARHLARAIQLSATFELLALEDEELQPSWKKFGLGD
jgi:hypothetical protein